MNQNGARKSSQETKQEKALSSGNATIGHGEPEQGKGAMATTSTWEKSTPLSADTPKDGKPTNEEADKPPKLTQDDEFEIFLSQIVDCKRAGIEMRWVKLDGVKGIALLIPEATVCQHKNVHLGAACFCAGISEK